MKPIIWLVSEEDARWNHIREPAKLIASLFKLTRGTKRSKRFPNWHMQAENRAISFMDQVSAKECH